MAHRIGFVSTRFAGTDGVSLESVKWAQVLRELGHEVFWYSGRSDRSADVSMVDREAFFGEPEVLALHSRLFRTRTRRPEDTTLIFDMAARLKGSVAQFVDDFDIDVLVVENALAIPMHVPLGVAIVQLIVERGLPTIAHHHDFSWERPRFAVNGVGDLLRMAFPPALPSIQHVTINSSAQRDLALHTGVSSTVVPNVLDFDTPPPSTTESAASFRADIGLGDEDVVLLQPTRVVPRKGIEHSIALASKLANLKVKLVITHESGDEGDEYLEMLEDMAAEHGVELALVNAHLAERGDAASSRSLVVLSDAYACADLVTFPSLYEGFGNALVEAFYFRKPVLVNRYSIFITDIEPKGFQVLTMDGYVTGEVVARVRELLGDPNQRAEMVEHNFERARAFFSFAVLRRKLEVLVANATGG